MSRWIEDAGERMSLYHAAAWLFVAMTVFGIMVAYWLMAKDRIGMLGAAGVMVLAWMLAAGLTAVIWTLSGAASRGLVQTMTGAGNLPPAPSFSFQESLVIRGKFDEAVEAFRAHLEQAPDDFHARLALAALARFAERFRDTPDGARARQAIARIKASEQ